MQIVDIFSGIGGFSLAGDWMNWKTVQFCEINPFGQKVLAHHFPGVPIHDNIKTLTAEQIINNGLYDKNETTILVGGVPCQPWSTAGKRLGKSDDRDLWEESINLAKSLRPDWIVFENVFGLINWSDGLVFHEVQTDLEAEGYEVFPYVLPACAVNAPHRRDRVWFVAHAASNGHDAKSKKRNNTIGQNNQQSGTQRFSTIEGLSNESNVTNPNSGRQPSEEYGQKKSGWVAEKGIPGNWQNFPTQSPICTGDDGLPTELDGITFPKWRNESIKASGNAIVPQVALQIFKAIQKYEQL
jgi:DNA (cytosine-5)-methyltransferase 1